MNAIDNLIQNFRRFVDLPWQTNLAPEHRVWFAVYPPAEERRLLAHVLEFQLATRDSGHEWLLVDISDSFGKWMAGNDYREEYYSNPETVLSVVEEEFTLAVAEELKKTCLEEDADDNTLVAVIGASGLFGFTHISAVLSKMDTKIKGRIMFFFPGEYDRNIYRFMNAHDGFNYRAVPITCHERFDA